MRPANSPFTTPPGVRPRGGADRGGADRRRRLRDLGAETDVCHGSLLPGRAVCGVPGAFGAAGSDGGAGATDRTYHPQAVNSAGQKRNVTLEEGMEWEGLLSEDTDEENNWMESLDGSS